MKEDIVSIIIPTYNRSHFIPETIRAIQNQSHDNFECFIIDDESNDDTEGVFRSMSLDSRFKYLKRSKNYIKGPSGCRNYGLDKASGRYIIFFDDDDIPHPDNLKVCLKHLKNGNYDFCRYQRAVFHGNFDYTFNSRLNYNVSNINGAENVLNLLSEKLPFNCCAVMWRKECFNENRFVECLQYAEEWELYSRILAAGKKGISINKTLYYARKHPNSNTGEFYSGNKNRMHSKIEASKLIISNLNQKNLLSPELIHFFCWESFRFRSPELLEHLRQLSSLSSFQKSVVILKYKLGPITQFLMRLKKRFK